MANSIAINLVKNRKPKILDQFIAWSLTIGRAVVILTEAIALGAFIYRFNLDRQLIDLHDKIVQQENIVGFFKKNEDTYRNLQNRLTLAKNTAALQDQLLKSYTDISNLIPSDVSLHTITFSPTNVHVEIIAQSITPIANLVNGLKNYSQIASVSVDNIETKASSGLITVGITATFKPIKPI